ncbi:flavin reductase family protein [Salinibacterium sp. dk2585]|uniref:flavin reductase family protein n=1 Tax=unclassified Salinibacterium TaxID=2632331 RepID=UPI0011C255B2|nr:MULTISPECIES: flavin reductase family protein [unclassified Salinibacterium]QEE62126.1 flavin reductase family protein [Salinibacterium sp. dk2585]TXK53478.1 flavin reductase family protein [Salinibacterium sp. dk5596]
MMTMTTDDPTLALRQAFSLFPTGVVAVAASVDGRPVGLAVNSFTSVSLDPALVGVCIANTSTTWPTLSSVKRLGLSILGAGQGAVCRTLSARGVDRFADVPWQAGEHGAVLIDDAALWLECEIHSSFPGGDHEVVLLKVVRSELFPDVAPLVFHQSRFRELQSA